MTCPIRSTPCRPSGDPSRLALLRLHRRGFEEPWAAAALCLAAGIVAFGALSRVQADQSLRRRDERAEAIPVVQLANVGGEAIPAA